MHIIPIRFRPRDLVLCAVTALCTVPVTVAVVALFPAITAGLSTISIPSIGNAEIETPTAVSAKEIEALFPPQHSPAGTVKILAAMPGPNGATLFTIGLTNGETRTATASSPGLKVGDTATASVVVYPSNGQYNHTWIVAATSKAEGLER